MKRILVISLSALSLTVVASAGASGGSTLLTAYGGKAGAVAAVVKQPKVVHKKVAPAKAKPVHVSGTLPFTGANLIWFGAAGVLLVSLGYGLRRASRQP